MPGLTPADVNKLDKKLRLYCWDPIPDFKIEDISKLQKTDNFTKENFEEAVSIYLHWKKDILPTIPMTDRDSIHLCFGQQIFNILHLLAPDHHIHRALKK